MSSHWADCWLVLSPCWSLLLGFFPLRYIHSFARAQSKKHRMRNTVLPFVFRGFLQLTDGKPGSRPTAEQEHPIMRSQAPDWSSKSRAARCWMSLEQGLFCSHLLWAEFPVSAQSLPCSSGPGVTKVKEASQINFPLEL